jgi:hypothetical protein
MVCIFLCCLVTRTKFLLASMETIINPKNCSQNPHYNFCTGFPICYSSISSSVHITLDAGKIRVNVPILGGFLYDISGPKAVFLKVFFRVNIAAPLHLKGVIRRIFIISTYVYSQK